MLLRQHDGLGGVDDRVLGATEREVRGAPISEEREIVGPTRDRLAVELGGLGVLPGFERLVARLAGPIDDEREKVRVHIREPDSGALLNRLPCAGVDDRGVVPKRLLHAPQALRGSHPPAPDGDDLPTRAPIRHADPPCVRASKSRARTETRASAQRQRSREGIVETQRRRRARLLFSRL